MLLLDDPVDWDVDNEDRVTMYVNSLAATVHARTTTITTTTLTLQARFSAACQRHACI